MTDAPAPLGIKIDQSDWPMPRHEKRAGLFVTLEPLALAHLDDLWAVASDSAESFAYLRYGPFETKAALAELLQDLGSRQDQPFWAVIPKGGKAAGWASICDIYQTDGSIEIGSIWFSPELQGTRAGREALFQLMVHCMDDLQYPRLVWRCQAQNAKSFRAAQTLGFKHEGTWRNAAIVNGWQRDIAWFSILQDEWPAVKEAFLNWLSPENFDEQGQQHRRLGLIA